jgi:hypothetical protein
MFERLKPGESEEHLKNIVADFLKDTWYKPSFEINTSGRADLVIHNGRSSNDPVGVIIEVKRPDNTAEMITPEKPNAKALHELLLYYLTERYLNDNKEIKRLIVCNIHEWYIFDAADFERFFFDNPRLVKGFREWKDGLFGIDKTEWFYREIAKPLIEKELTELPCTCFDLREFAKSARRPEGAEDRKFIALYKLLSPPHLLKLPFGNDSNTLNKEFYTELLHILGLQEVKEKGKRLIRRKPQGERDEASMLENAANILKVRQKLAFVASPEQYGATEEEQLFSIALELCITWLNRILFLKLLEGQLIAYHQGDRSFAFLNAERVRDFDELEELFFEVLAVRVDQRSESVHAKFGAVPYLNSSLFEESDLERAALHITALKGRLDLPLYSATVLKDGGGRRRTGCLSTLRYLFEFLDAFDFTSEGGAEIEESGKTLINASVLGLIFEKINGYKDGSFFTPGFITMYMCRESIRRAVLRKFNGRYGWSCGDITELYNKLDKIGIKEANEVVNSLKICDPAVGSGHFLVSALNEIIAVKSDLGLLVDCEGKRLRDYSVTVENDELIVTCEDRIFAYNPKDPESRRVQEALFYEKATLIENCLFGVDINPKSVAICRLRLWIELLKHAYYTKGSDHTELETLPNIDINIKCGNSLVSRFALTGAPNVLPADRKKLKELTERYRRYVFDYKLSPANKAQLRKVIDNLKEDLQNFGLPNDKDLAALRKKSNELAQLSLFAYDKKEAAARQKLQNEVDALEKRFAEKQRSIYRNAFEWRFEFPEVLDENGEFEGFDVVIGNPPYIRIQDLKEWAPHEVAFQKEQYRAASKGNYDIYVVFVERGLSLLGKYGTLGYILPHKFFNSQYGEPLRQVIADGRHLSEVIHFGQHQVFDEATTYTCFLFLNRQRTEEFRFVRVEDLIGWRSGRSDAVKEGELPATVVTAAAWNFATDSGTALFDRLENMPVKLSSIAERLAQGIRTSANEVYVLDVREDNGETITAYSKHLDKEVMLERQAVSAFLQGREIKPYQVLPSGKVVVVPYRIHEGRQKLISQQEYKQFYPKTWDYLLQNKPYLENREQGKMKCENWYSYVYPKNIEVMQSAKILVPDIAERASFALDETGEFAFTSGYGITFKEEVQLSPKFILALLNSQLLDFFLKRVSTAMRGGFFRYFTQFISQLPIPSIDFATVQDKNRHDCIIALVDQILAAKKADPQADISARERQIDALVYELYGLTEEEIAVVEGREKDVFGPEKGINK